MEKQKRFCSTTFLYLVLVQKLSQEPNTLLGNGNSYLTIADLQRSKCKFSEYEEMH